MNKKSILYKTLRKIKFFLLYPKHYMNVQRSINEQVNFYSNFISKGDLVFDVGANIGDKTFVFRKLGAKVVAVEPQIWCSNKIAKRFKGDNKVVLVNKGLSDAEGEIEMSICETAPTISTMSKKWKTEGRFAGNYNWNKTEKVSLTTLNNLIDQYGVPVYCKIDVEGFELNVLKGLSTKIPLISFEYTTEFFDDAEKCIAHLESLGEIEMNAFMEPGEFLFDHYDQPTEVLSKLKSLNDKDLAGDIYVRFTSFHK